MLFFKLRKKTLIIIPMELLRIPWYIEGFFDPSSFALLCFAFPSRKGLSCILLHLPINQPSSPLPPTIPLKQRTQ